MNIESESIIIETLLKEIDRLNRYIKILETSVDFPENFNTSEEGNYIHYGKQNLPYYINFMMGTKISAIIDKVSKIGIHVKAFNLYEDKHLELSTYFEDPQKCNVSTKIAHLSRDLDELKRRLIYEYIHKKNQ